VKSTNLVQLLGFDSVIYQDYDLDSILPLILPRWSLDYLKNPKLKEIQSQPNPTKELKMETILEDEKPLNNIKKPTLVKTSPKESVKPLKTNDEKLGEKMETQTKSESVTMIPPPKKVLLVNNIISEKEIIRMDPIKEHEIHTKNPIKIELEPIKEKKENPVKEPPKQTNDHPIIPSMSEIISSKQQTTTNSPTNENPKIDLKKLSESERLKIFLNQIFPD
jgi:hypothetical protein